MVQNLRVLSRIYGEKITYIVTFNFIVFDSDDRSDWGLVTCEKARASDAALSHELIKYGYPHDPVYPHFISCDGLLGQQDGKIALVKKSS